MYLLEPEASRLCNNKCICAQGQRAQRVQRTTFVHLAVHSHFLTVPIRNNLILIV